jgi:hypothetical protein
MVKFEFTSVFRHWAERARKHCVLCKAMTLFEHQPGTREVSEEVAAAAEAAGKGKRVGSVEPAAPAESKPAKRVRQKPSTPSTEA